jgi:hypothetical protein
MSTADDLRARARAFHAEGILSADGLDRFLKALETDEATPSEYIAFLDHIETRRDAGGPVDTGPDTA